MTAPSRIYLLVPVVAVLGWASFAKADDDVTVISSTPPASDQAKKNATNADGTPVVHKSSHVKKHANTETASTGTAGSTSSAAGTATSFGSTMPRQVQFPPLSHTLPPAPANMVPARTASTTTSVPSVSAVAPGPAPSAASPSVETGLPVAQPGVSTYHPPPRQTYFASALPVGVPSLASPAVGEYSIPNRPPPAPLTDFNFASTSRRYHNTYPWKTNILTTKFWIGEGSTPISSTTNVQSSWDEEWMQKNRGSDNPYDRNGYASGSHASTLNPFYVALPFNDLAFPDKAREWLPRGWYRPPRDGKQVSACKDRWVEIKNARGDICYAQWEDVGPLRYDHAEYVFGNERPTGLGDDHAGLDVSPAVADYLELSDHNRYMSWRFVDEDQVRPGAWLKLDEQAVIFTALEQLKNRPLASPPIQRSSEPLEDPGLDPNKKKIDRAN
jgi:hypothetical protein